MFIRSFKVSHNKGQKKTLLKPKIMPREFTFKRMNCHQARTNKYSSQKFYHYWQYLHPPRISHLLQRKNNRWPDSQIMNLQKQKTWTGISVRSWGKFTGIWWYHVPRYRTLSSLSRFFHRTGWGLRTFASLWEMNGSTRESRSKWGRGGFCTRSSGAWWEWSLKSWWSSTTMSCWPQCNNHKGS